MRHLLGEARRLGVSVHIAHITDDPSLRGYFLPDTRMVVLRMGMTRAQTRSVLAHELGHAFHGHHCDSATAERQADGWAAAFLIDPERYAELEQLSADRHFLADELDVTPDIIDAYREQCLVRLGRVTYARPKMGVGQWMYRSADA